MDLEGRKARRIAKEKSAKTLQKIARGRSERLDYKRRKELRAYEEEIATKWQAAWRGRKEQERRGEAAMPDLGTLHVHLSHGTDIKALDSVAYVKLSLKRFTYQSRTTENANRKVSLIDEPTA